MEKFEKVQYTLSGLSGTFRRTSREPEPARGNTLVDALLWALYVVRLSDSGAHVEQNVPPFDQVIVSPRWGYVYEIRPVTTEIAS